MVAPFFWIQFSTLAAACLAAASMTPFGLRWNQAALLCQSIVMLSIGMSPAVLSFGAYSWLCVLWCSGCLFFKSRGPLIQRMFACFWFGVGVDGWHRFPAFFQHFGHLQLGYLTLFFLLVGLFWGVLWLWQGRHIISARWSDRLPPLEVSGRCFVQWLACAWVCLTQAVLSGFFSVSPQLSVHQTLIQGRLGLVAWVFLIWVLSIQSVLGRKGFRVFWVCLCLLLLVWILITGGRH